MNKTFLLTLILVVAALGNGANKMNINFSKTVHGPKNFDAYDLYC